uniref:ABC1 atypical kinase-like domain-containing protein n=2 Tax=Globodera rostochiensis TaxID=31243 RepID=A0A914I621_GLORO
MLRLLIDSQLGYELRHLRDPIRERIVQAAVLGGNVVSVDENQNYSVTNKKAPTSFAGADVLDRARVVAVGVETFMELASRGVFPGFGGYELASQGLINKVPEQQQQQYSTVVPLVKQQNIPFQNDGLTREEEAFLRRAAMEVGVVCTDNEQKVVGLPKTISDGNSISSEPTIPKDYRPSFTTNPRTNSAMMDSSREFIVPASRVARLFNFGRLAVGLGTGAVAEIARRTLSAGVQSVQPPVHWQHSLEDRSTRTIALPQKGSSQPTNPLLSTSNVERIAQTLCRVRGAALKLGQMLSIQDEHTVPSYLSQAFERVRQSADFMPSYQVDRQMSQELGANWQKLFREFDERPFAAASIGQVHKAITLDGVKVAVKVQYPGVAEGIDSDIDNLLSVLNIGGFFPKGMFLDNFATVSRRELKAECNYEREARAVAMFRRLLADDENFFVPGIFSQLSTKRVLTAEFVEGTPVDLCNNEPQQVRDWIATRYIELSLKELFVWRFMQTDPNWSNFLFARNSSTGHYQLVLLDFGSTRSFSKSFIDKYMRILKAAYANDRNEMLKWSRDIGFLTGYETKVMAQAHCDAISIIGETLTNENVYDFSEQSVTPRINKLVPVMLEHRLTAPPDEIYSLHRKLAGAFLTAAKLKARVACGAMFNKISDNYAFGEHPGTAEINID